MVLWILGGDEGFTSPGGALSMKEERADALDIVDFVSRREIEWYARRIKGGARMP